MRRKCRYRNNPTFGIFDKCCVPLRRIEGEESLLEQGKKNMRRRNKSSLRNNVQCCRAASHSAATSNGDHFTEDASLLDRENPNQSKIPSPGCAFPLSLRRGRSYGAAFIRSTKKKTPGTKEQKAWKNASACISKAASKVSLNKFRGRNSRNESYESFDSRGTPSPTPSDESSYMMDQYRRRVRSGNSQSCQFSAEIITSEFNKSKSNVFRSLELEIPNSNFLKVKSDSSDALSLPSRTEDARHSSGGSELDSLCSTPSFSFSLEDIDIKVNQVRNDDVADSVVAWGLLAALMGAPAPAAVMLQEKKRTSEAPINLWQDGDCSICDDIEDIMAISQVTDDCISQKNEIYCHSDDTSIPSLVTTEGLIVDASYEFEFDDFADIAKESTSTKNVLESSIAWCSLAALIGSSAPSSVIPEIKAAKKTRRSLTQKLWCRGESKNMSPLPWTTDGNEDGAFVKDDIPDLPYTPDDFLTVNTENSLSSELLNYESVFTDFTSEPVHGESSRKGVGDSVLAWSALTALLASPAPEVTFRRRHKDERRSPKNLWVDNDADEDDIDMISLSTSSNEDSFIGTIDGQDGGEDELHSIPSLNPHSDSSAVGVCSKETRDEDMVGDKRPSKIVWIIGDLFGDDVASIVESKSLDDCLENEAVIDYKRGTATGQSEPVEADDQSIPSLKSGSFDEDDLTTPLTPDKSLSSLESKAVSPQSKDNEKEVTISVLAWSALAAIMGSPAPNALKMRRKRSLVKTAHVDLRKEDFIIENEEVDSLPLI